MTPWWQRWGWWQRWLYGDDPRAVRMARIRANRSAGARRGWERRRAKAADRKAHEGGTETDA